MFTGREYDAESGLYHYRARAYSPVIGRFLQRDPIGYYDSMNLFEYAQNNPINWLDPLGLTCTDEEKDEERVKNEDSKDVKVPLWEEPPFIILTLIKPRVYFRGPEWGQWKWRGEWFKGWHFHLGEGSLGKHHLPQQFGNWWKNLLNIVKKRFHL